MFKVVPCALGVLGAGVFAKGESALQSFHAITPLASFGSIVFLLGAVNQWLAATVNHARITYDVAWPHLYAPESNPSKHAFDCVQRAHQAFLEGLIPAVPTFLVSAYAFPALTLVVGLSYVSGRILFALGYQSGDVKKKDQGLVPSYITGLLPLTALAFVGLVRELKLIK
eukprot:c8527_g1_i1.p1 GENE.c8527_g1_i1~~c8527_g1_i1.p1  ORF type:complete len:199 (-),score=38.66 c8527_g1_i1:81-590(-)